MPNSGRFEVISTSKSFTGKIKKHQHLLKQFTNQWRKSYLSSLRENHTGCSKKREGGQISIADVVISKEGMSNIMFWRLATVERLLPGGDGVVRNALAKFAARNGRPQLTKQSVKTFVSYWSQYDSSERWSSSNSSKFISRLKNQTKCRY